MNKKICVLGAGSWGTTLATLLANKGKYNISLWEFSPTQAQILDKTRKLSFLPELSIPKNISITSDIDSALKEAMLIVFATPSRFVRSTTEAIRNNSKNIDLKNVLIVSVTKGLENDSFLRMSQLLSLGLPQVTMNNICVLSGPSHAEEVSKGIPTTIVSASKSMDTAKIVQAIFVTDFFRVYTNDDLIGVELGGAIKNIYAIACGICDGLNLGDNTKAGLVTRGLSEMTRLGVKLGAKAHTFSGLSGMGDLIVTCFSRHSRNRLLGEKLARGKSLKTALKEIKMVAEGLPTSQSVHFLSNKIKVEMPIAEQIYLTLYKNKSAKMSVNELMTRKTKAEI